MVTPMPLRRALLLGIASACMPAVSQATEAPRPVRTIVVTETPAAETIIQTGEIRPRRETDLGFRIDGRLTQRAVEIGTVVRRGDLLALLDENDAANQLRMAEADLASARSAEAVARAAMDRQRTLLDREIVARARFEEAEGNWRTAVARRESAAAALQTARNRVAYTRLEAEEDGAVTAIGANPGQVVQPGQMVVRLASIAEREAVFDVSERIVTVAPADIPVTVSLTSNPAIRLVGQVREVSPAADPATRSFRVRVTLPDAPEAMALGATVTGRASVPQTPLILLPASALTSEDGAPAVYVLDPQARVLRRQRIEVARYTADSILVTAGLTPGQRVVTAGVSRLRPGQAVAGEERR